MHACQCKACSCYEPEDAVLLGVGTHAAEYRSARPIPEVAAKDALYFVFLADRDIWEYVSACAGPLAAPKFLRSPDMRSSSD